METLHALIGSEDGAINWWQMTLRGLLVFMVGVLAARVAPPAPSASGVPSKSSLR